MPPYLPGEVTDVVIAHVSPDSHSLCSCALVGREWLPASRYHLFLTIQIDNLTTYTLFLERVLRSTEMAIWLEHTHELRLLNTEDPETVAGFPSPFGKRFLYEFAGHMPGLQSLELFHIDFANGGFHPGAYVAFSRFASVRMLAFTNCLFPSFTAFRRLLAGLPSLRDLALSNVHWHPVLPHHYSHLLIGAPSRPRFKLDSLFIADVDPDSAAVFFEWLDRTTSSQTIQIFSFEASMASALAPDPKSLHIRGDLLSPTDVHIWLYEDVVGLRELLPRFTQVRSLRITAPDMSEQSIWTQLSEMLEVIASPAIRNIAVDGFMNDVLEADLESGDVKGLLGVPTRGLELLEQVLGRTVFEHLTALDMQLQQWVALPLDVQVAQTVVREAMQSKLPKAHERGILNLDLQFTRAIFCGLPLTKEEHNEGTGIQGWTVV